MKSWRKLFLDFYKIKNFWITPPLSIDAFDNGINSGGGGGGGGDSSSSSLVLGRAKLVGHTGRTANKEKFKVNVFARFRPLAKEAPKEIGKEIGKDKDNDNLSSLPEDKTEITLPLHQRLKMIKMAKNLKSNKQALQMLAAEGEWFRDKWVGSAAPNTDTEHNKENKSAQFVINIETNENKLNVGFNPSKSGVKFEKNTARVEQMDGVTNRVVVVAPGSKNIV